MKKQQFLCVLAAIALAVAMPTMAQDWSNWTVHRLNTPPTLDGTVNASEWPSNGLTMNATTMAANAGSRNDGDAFDPNMEVTFYYGWDDDWFYGAAKVTDDDVVFLGGPDDPLNGTDGIQTCFDHQNLNDDSALNDGGVYIVDVVPGTTADNAQADWWQHWNTAAGDRLEFPNTQVASRMVDGGYELEWAISWDDFVPAFSPSEGHIMGYLALLMDFTSGGINQLWWNAGDGEGIIGGPTSAWPKMTLAAAETEDTDRDDDGLTNEEEETLGTNPDFADTDGDGLSDGAEVNTHNTDPLASDTDGDGVNDGTEVAFGSDPNDPNDTVALPVAGYAALALLALLLTGAGAWALRRRIA